ncbi:MAG: YceI family protein [Actinomycetota bacterium]
MTQTQGAVSAAELGVALPEPGTYKLEPSHTSIGFVARHMLSKTRGNFSEFEGTITVPENVADTAVDVTIQAASISTGHEMRDGHLNSNDFFTVEEYPTITFAGKGIRQTEGADFELDGDLTIKGITRPVTLEGEYLGFGPGMQGEQRIFASAKATVNREDWDLTWNVAVETGGLLVGKKVDIVLDLEAVKEA